MELDLKSTVILLLMAVAILVIGIFIVKKAFKLLISTVSILLVIILGTSAYNIIVNKTSPLDEVKAYKTNILYIKDITNYTKKINESVNEIKSIVDSNNYTKENIQLLNEEIRTLEEYRSTIKGLEHTQKLDTLHNMYTSYLDTVTDTTVAAQKLIMNGNMAKEKAGEYSNQITEQLNKLLNLKIKI